MQQVLGLLTFVVEPAPTLLGMEVPVVSPYEEGTGTPPVEVWYTDGSAKGHPPTWVPVAIQSLQEESWYEPGVWQSSQWAELQALWLV